MVAAEDDRDGAGRGDLADLAVDHRVRRARSRPGRCWRRRRRRRSGPRTAPRRAGASGSSRSCTAPRGSRAARSERPGRWLTASSNGAPTIATSTFRRAQLGRVGDPGQLHERRRADVGRQVEVVEGLELAVPAVAAPRSPGRAPGRGGARPRMSSGRRPRRRSAADGRVRLARGAAGSSPPSSGARRADGSTGSTRRPTPSRRAELPPGGLDERRVARTGRSAVWATSVAASRVVSSARGRRGGVAELDRVAGRALRRDREVRVDRGQTQQTLPMSVLPAFGSSPSSAIP